MKKAFSVFCICSAVRSRILYNGYNSVLQPENTTAAYTKELGLETFVFPIVFIGIFAAFASVMGLRFLSLNMIWM